LPACFKGGYIVEELISGESTGEVVESIARIEFLLLPKDEWLDF
jgi:hypothetical protein